LNNIGHIKVKVSATYVQKIICYGIKSHNSGTTQDIIINIMQTPQTNISDNQLRCLK